MPLMISFQTILLLAYPLAIHGTPTAHSPRTALRGASNFTEACPGCQQCASENGWCSEALPCCDADTRCESYVGGSGAKCVKQNDECVAEEAICGGHGMLTHQCCGDFQCQWRGDKMRCVSMDTPNWHNGYHYCSSEVPKDSGTKYCSSEGWTCAGYEWHGWCQHGEIHYGSGAQFNYPEDNCCACGKTCNVGSGSLSATSVVNNISNSSTDTSLVTASSLAEVWPGYFDNTNCYKGGGAEENVAGPAGQCGSHANQVSPDLRDLFNPSYCGVGDIGYCSALAQESGANCYSIRKKTGGCYLRKNCNKAQCQTNTDFETYIGGGALYPDPSQDNKKCGEQGASQRTFTLYGSDASEENCKQSCENDGRCVAMSGQFWGSTWCVGCSQRLWVYAANAAAYSKRWALYADPSQDNKKCGEQGASQRTFTLYGSDASEENCKQSCENDSRCVAMSGQFWGSTWCVGCSQRLWEYAANAKAYSKR